MSNEIIDRLLEENTRLGLEVEDLGYKLKATGTSLEFNRNYRKKLESRVDELTAAIAELRETRPQTVASSVWYNNYDDLPVDENVVKYPHVTQVYVGEADPTPSDGLKEYTLKGFPGVWVIEGDFYIKLEGSE